MRQKIFCIAVSLMTSLAILAEERMVGDFNAMTISGPVEVTYSQDATCSIVVEGNEARIANLVTEVDASGCLNIKPKPINKRQSTDVRGVKIMITSPILKKLHCSDQVKFVSLTDIDNAIEPMDIKVSGEVELNLSGIAAGNVSIVTEDYSTVKLSGDIQAENLRIESAGENGILLQGAEVSEYAFMSVNILSKLEFPLPVACDSLRITALGANGEATKATFTTIETRVGTIVADENVELTIDNMYVRDLGIEASRAEVNINSIDSAKFVYVIATREANVKIANITSDQANFNSSKSSNINVTGAINIAQQKIDRTSKIQFDDKTVREVVVEEKPANTPETSVEEKSKTEKKEAVKKKPTSKKKKPAKKRPRGRF